MQICRKEINNAIEKWKGKTVHGKEHVPTT